MGGMISTDLIRGHTDTIILNILRKRRRCNGRYDIHRSDPRPY
jgi:hypothetical protein